MEIQNKRPAFQFYAGDWLRDTALRACSMQTRGLWIDMICLMHQTEPYGHLTLNGKAMDVATLARIVGGTTASVKKNLDELETAGVFSRSPEGFIFSRRMVKDERLRNTRAVAGHEGGNPKLTHGYNKPGYLYAFRRSSDGATKIGIAINPMNRLYKLRQSCKPDQIEFLDCIEVQDMGLSELKAHESMVSKKVIGEWFDLSPSDLVSLGFTLKGKKKDKQTPSSSSSSSSSKTEEKDNAPVGASPLSLLLAYGVNETLAEDYLRLRKAKRAPLSETVLEGLEREAGLAGITVADAVRITVERGWQGFKAAWITEEKPKLNAETDEELIARLRREREEYEAANATH